MIGTIALITAILLMPIPTLAGGFRCGNRVVSTGDTKAEVLAKCGEPVTIDEEVVETAVSRRLKRDVNGPGHRQGARVRISSTRTIETWTYNFGSNRLMRILTFEGSELKRIEDGDYGYNP